MRSHQVLSIDEILPDNHGATSGIWDLFHSLRRCSGLSTWRLPSFGSGVKSESKAFQGVWGYGLPPLKLGAAYFGVYGLFG